MLGVVEEDVGDFQSTVPSPDTQVPPPLQRVEMSPSVVTADTPMDLSTKTRRKLRLEEFLRQNLDQAPATRVIQWVNRDQGVFRILWTHQSSGAFTQQDAALFRYWALARGGYLPY